MGGMQNSDSASPQETTPVETQEEDRNEPMVVETKETAEKCDAFQNTFDNLLIQNLSQTLEILRELKLTVLQIQFSVSQVMEKQRLQSEKDAPPPPAPVPSKIWSWRPATVAEEVAENVLETGN